MIDMRISINSIARVQSAWKHAPHELLSLWDMIEFPAHALKAAVFAMNSSAKDYRLNLFKSPAENLDDILAEIGKILVISDTLDLVVVNDRCTRLMWALQEVIRDDLEFPDPALIISHCSEIEASIEKELGERRFAFIPKGRAALFENRALFENLVAKRFPSASEDIKDAGTCLALGLNQAAIYHLMRVMEFGLLLMHKKLLRTPPANPNWAAVIQELEKEIRDRDKATRTPMWKKQREFFIECANQFYFFKDKRNKAVHVELDFMSYVPTDSETAVRIFGHVKGFMQHLATKLKE